MVKVVKVVEVVNVVKVVVVVEVVEQTLSAPVLRTRMRKTNSTVSQIFPTTVE